MTQKLSLPWAINDIINYREREHVRRDLIHRPLFLHHLFDWMYTPRSVTFATGQRKKKLLSPASHPNITDN